MLERLRGDLLGDEGDHVLNELPLSRFVVGVLYPEVLPNESGTAGEVEVSTEIDEEQEVGGQAADAQADPAVSMAHARHPRSMGLSFAVEVAEGAELDITVTAARYVEQPGGSWVREEIGPWNLQLSVAFAAEGLHRHAVTDGLQLVSNVRHPRDGVSAVTLTLLNTNTARPGRMDGGCWFAPEIVVRAVGGSIRERPASRSAALEELEVASQRLLFREVQSFGVGHGCAVEWDGPRPEAIRTTFIPTHELLLSEASGGPSLSMDALAADADLRVLDELVDGYEAWIAEVAKSPGLDPVGRTTLARHAEDARAAADRMRAGIDVLRSDESARRAFQLMNAAMAQQRSRQEHHRAGRLGDPPTTSTARWRPFQMAFILLNLRGLAQPDHPDRRIADLLWFPTGGGKTEAYLGIIGIAIMLRRLRDPRAGGVSVLMRYTLRLLTLQQYQRATGLICALEMQRLTHLPDTEPVSIGLWVGRQSTPNSVKEAETFLRKARQNRGAEMPEDASDPVQLRQCPWCGSALDYRNYEITNRRMRVACPVDNCAFRNGLPVHILDEDVYGHRPSLVIGTVDKFAMMPWKEEVGSLLGVPRAGDRSVDVPPDLIVQDELHLISGPLGTMVGLYETAVDAITGRQAAPKLVASTATIRRASDQVRAVFGREARQFPPPGASYRDSYFAKEAARDVKATRMYSGVMAAGASTTTLMVRVYASLLQSAGSIPDSDSDADLYWSLLGYFNSLRVLGGAFIQVLDDVPDQIKVIATRRGEEPRGVREVREMTSRKRSSEIPLELELLERCRGDHGAADVVLATNMISVGVDVDRLGLMVVTGQPQTTAEYIQATSRVGRRAPGLVVTIHNAARSRDLSHYENFSAYHRSLYRHVEATGATPFAPRARDRALHAVLVALARHRIPEAGPSSAAGAAPSWEEALRDQARVIIERAQSSRSCSGPVPDDESDEAIERELAALIDEWLSSRPNRYEGWFGKDDGALLAEASRAARGADAPSQFPPKAPPWPTLTSMRDVDAESQVYRIRRKRDRRGA